MIPCFVSAHWATFQGAHVTMCAFFKLRFWSDIVLPPTLRLRNNARCYSARPCICVVTFLATRLSSRDKSSNARTSHPWHRQSLGASAQNAVQIQESCIMPRHLIATAYFQTYLTTSKYWWLCIVRGTPVKAKWQQFLHIARRTSSTAINYRFSGGKVC